MKKKLTALEKVAKLVSKKRKRFNFYFDNLWDEYDPNVSNHDSSKSITLFKFGIGMNCFVWLSITFIIFNYDFKFTIAKGKV
jgi:hypothetical protein